MSTKPTTRSASKQLGTQLRDGAMLDDDSVEDFVRLDQLDRAHAAGTGIVFTVGQSMRLARLVQREDTGFLAFLAHTGVPRVKIGFTRDPDRRISQLRSMSALPVDVVTMVRAPADYAQALHRALHHLHSHGEWFEVDAWMAAFLADVRVRRFRAVHEVVHRQGLYSTN